MAHIIEIENVTKTYGKHRGVENISLAVEEGDIFAFLGPNGAGKSTTIRSMLGMLQYEGNIRILGMDARTQKTEILKEVGYMPSEVMFYPAMKVKDVIRFAADMHKKDCSEEAGRLCEKLQVDTAKKIQELSLGNRKKVSIVCALQHQPKLLILDEPTSGLDPLMQDTFLKAMEHIETFDEKCKLTTWLCQIAKNTYFAWYHLCNSFGYCGIELYLTASIHNVAYMGHQVPLGKYRNCVHGVSHPLFLVLAY